MKKTYTAFYLHVVQICPDMAKRVVRTGCEFHKIHFMESTQLNKSIFVCMLVV